jgi:arylsulfatase A-like enzyme
MHLGPRGSRGASAIAALLPLAALLFPGCRSQPFPGPAHLVERPTEAGILARSGTVTVGGDARPALLESARYRIRLPKRPLLTFGMGVSYAGVGDPPGWYRLTVRAGDAVVADKTLNPRAAHGWRDVSVPLEDLGSRATLAFDLRLADREGGTLSAPSGLVLAVADPTIHDLDAYGSTKGIVLISIDTLRRDHVGAYGYPKATTPRLDSLAREGLLCEDAVSTSSWTLPAHLSLLTSADPAAHGGVDMQHGFNHRLPTLAATLKKAGFATEAITSHLYVSSVYGADDGFDRMDFHQDRKATDVAVRATDVLDRVGDRPFFLFLHFYDPHWHYDPPEATRRLFTTGEYHGTITGRWQDFRDRTRADTSAEDLDQLRALYDGEIRYTDDEIGRVLDHLKTRGLDRGTLVVVTSDHGEEFLEHGGFEHQKTLYEEVIRIPLLVSGPGVAPRREPLPVSLLDVMPTILAWARVDPLAPLQGKSLLASPADRETYGETDHGSGGTRRLFLRAGAGRWKTILTFDRATEKLRGEEWFELGADPGETSSVPPRAEVAQAVRDRLVARWREARGRGVGAPSVELTAEQKERLRALGYVLP